MVQWIGGGLFYALLLGGGEAIGFEEVIFVPSGVSGVSAVEEKVVVPIDNCVLKVVEC